MKRRGGGLTELTAKTDEELLTLARAGDTRAEELLYARYKNVVRVKTHAYFIVGADRDDLLQEGMIGLYKAVRDYSASCGASFRTFAEMCIHRQIVTAIKTATRQKHIPLNSYISLYKNSEDPERSLIDTLQLTGEDPADTFLGKERAKQMETLLQTALSDFEKRVLSLYMDGCSYAQAAERLGRSVKAVDNALQRIKKKMAHAQTMD